MYFCEKCGYRHKESSGIGKRHALYAPTKSSPITSGVGEQHPELPGSGQPLTGVRKACSVFDVFHEPEKEYVPYTPSDIRVDEEVGKVVPAGVESKFSGRRRTVIHRWPWKCQAKIKVLSDTHAKRDLKKAIERVNKIRVAVITSEQMD